MASSAPPAVDPVGDAAAADVLRRVVGNTSWLFSSSVFVRLVNLARGVILARLLSPDDFGLSTLSTTIVGLTLVASDIGAANFLFFRPREAREHADTAFWLNATMVTGFASALLLAAPWIARTYERPELVPLLRVSAATFWCQGIITVQRSLLRNDLRFRALSMIDGAAGLAAFGTGVGLALAGSGVWSLIACLLAGAVVTMVLQAVAAGWRPAPRIRPESVRAILGFSGWYIGCGLAATLILSLDSFMIGKWLDVQAVGVYGLAMLYAMLPFPLIASSLGQAAYPELLKLQGDPDRFWTTFHRASRMLVLAVAPIAAAGIATAPALFHLAFGAKWNAAIPPFQILLAFALVRSLWIDPIASMGRFRGAFLLNVVVAVAAFAAIRLGLAGGVAGVAWAMLIIGSVWQVATLLVASGSPRRVLASLAAAAAPVLAAGALVLVAGTTERALLGSSAERPWLSIAVTLPVILGGYALLFRRSIAGLGRLLLRSPAPDGTAA